MTEEEVSLTKIRAAALALLTRRAYTAKELKTRLQKKGFPPEEIGGVISEFREKRYLDDYAYALVLAQDGLKRKGWARRRADLALKEKGVGPAEREQVLNLVYSPTDEVKLARDLMRKKWRRGLPPDPLKARRQAAGYLARRGFSAETIAQVLRKPLSDEEEF